MIVAVVLALTACPHRFDPSAAPAITSPDEGANREFLRAKKQFDGGKLEHAELAFSAFATSHPADPLAPVAALYRGRIALAQSRLERARQLLSPLVGRPDVELSAGPHSVGTRARYYLGMVQVRMGAFQQGRRLLSPFLTTVAEADRPALLVALAHAAQKLGDLPSAVQHLAQLHASTTRPAEKLHARVALESLILGGRLARSRLRTIYDGAAAGSLLAAVSGQRLAVLESAAGNAALAQKILSATTDARERHNVRADPFAVSPSVVGLLAPLGGRYRAAGRELLRGAVEASGALQADGKGQLTLAVRDASKDPATAARQLIDEEHVVALVGTLSPKGGRTTAELAARAGVPFIALARLAPSPGSQPAIELIPDNQQRAEALARNAMAAKLRRVVVLAPESSYGRAMARAFTAAGAPVTAQLTYASGTTSFSKVAEKLAGMNLDGLFLPDTAHNLSLLAPALARAGLWSGRASTRDRKARSIQLLATADGLSPRLVAAAGRYVQGAVLAPGFFADETAPSSGALVRRFVQNQGGPPTLVAALGFDAVELVRALRGRGARSRAEIRAALLSGQAVQGLTGKIRFDRTGQRADPPLLYRVEGDKIRLIDSARAGGPAGRTPPSAPRAGL